TYLIQSAIVALSMQIAINRLHVSYRYATLAGVLCFLSPAFGLQELYYPSFAFDLLAALLVLAGINELLKNNLLPSWIYFSLAVFTKETALFAPFLAAIVVLAEAGNSSSRPRRWVKAGVFLVPILVWTGLRRFDFSGAGGTYVLNNFSVSGQAILLLHAILSWPMGMRIATQAPVYKYVFFSLNLLFWLLLVLGIVLSAASPSTDGPSRWAAIADRFGFSGRHRVIVLAFCVGSLLLPLGLNLQQRFGAIFYPLFFLLIVCVLQSAPGRRFRLAAFGVCCFVIVVAQVQRAASPDGLRQMEKTWARSADYVKNISETHATTLFTVDDLSGGFASPDSVKKFTGYSGALVRLSDIVPAVLSQCISQPDVSIQQIAPASVSISSTLSPACGSVAFDGAALPFIDFSHHPVTRTVGKVRISYAMPDDSGKLSVVLDSIPENSAILIPEIQQKRYREVPLGPQTGM
ncbi:MAG: hypothetical protein ABI164_00620, partial [Acidobacteriaceae bacterium]